MEGRITVFVPKPDSDLVRTPRPIAPGSGIVGTQLIDAADVLIDFEGNIYGASNIPYYADRVMVAAERHTSKYPTVARMVVKGRDLIEVGEYDGDAVYVYPDAVVALAEWLGVKPNETLDPHELHRSGREQR